MSARGLSFIRRTRRIGSRPLALCVALAAALGCLVVASARARLGDAAPWPAGHELQIFRAGPPLPNFVPRATLQAVPVGWPETAGAAGRFAGAFAQALGPRGALWWIVVAGLAAALWWGLAILGEWRRPAVPFCILLAAQGFGAAYYFASFGPPARRLETPFTAFDFHCHTTRSNGLLTPQQQIAWHRERGFKGLAFTDSNRLMPRAELNALRAANPDLLLLNGCEYHGHDAHLILLDLKTAVAASDYDVPAAIAAAKKQGALVIVPHPWYPARYRPDEFLKLGVNGFEAWNGQIGSRELAQFDRDHNLIAITATDTLSKSGARCFTWTLLPKGLVKPEDVLRALRLRKTAAAFALAPGDTPEAYDAAQRRLRRPTALAAAARAAWADLTVAQRLSTVLGLIAVAALLWCWGAAPPPVAPPLGPSFATGFLRRRRLVPRVLGVALMLLAFAGSGLAALLTMGMTFKTTPAPWHSQVTPLHAVFAWLALDALYLYGRALWRRRQ